MKFDSMTGKRLDEALALIGVVRRTESDRELLERAREQLGFVGSRGTLRDIDGIIEVVIIGSKPVFVKTSAAKRDLSVAWLGRQKPDGLLARVRWYWRLLRDLRRAPR